MCLHQVKKKRRRTPLMLAETIDGGLCPQLLRERMMNEYLCKFEERLCSSGSLLSQLELVEEHMSNKYEDFDEESCIIDGDQGRISPAGYRAIPRWAPHVL